MASASLDDPLTAFREIDRLARARKVGVLATGVNPGFAMDALALTLTGPCAKVRRVAVTRVVDAGGKLTIQRRVGAGLNLGQFRPALTEGTIRHVGLPQSAQMIASALGWKLERLDESVEPAIAPRDLDTEYLRIPAGAVAGVKQVLRAYRGAELAVSLDLQVYVGDSATDREAAHAFSLRMLDEESHGGSSESWQAESESSGAR